MYRGLGCYAAIRHLAHTRAADGDLAHHIARLLRDQRQRHLGDRHGIARPHLAQPLERIGKPAGYVHCIQQLVLLQRDLLVALMELGIVQHARSARRDDLYRRAVRKQRRRRVCSRGGVHNVAAQRAAVLVRDGASPARRQSEQRKLLRDQLIFSDVGKGRARADRKSVGGLRDEAQLLHAPQAYQLLRLQPAHAEHHHYLGAARDWGVFARMFCKRLQHALQRARGDQIVFRHIRTHDYLPAPHFSTASKMR